MAEELRYRDLVHFDPIEEVIQIRDADKIDIARRHVQTYVISEHMARSLTDVIIPQLQFEAPSNNKGVLIVGNYGTGKSHLMSVISAVAEYPNLAEELQNPKVAEQAKIISNKFKVWRVEIGAVTRSLRDILISELETALEEWGTPYHFPPADNITSHKDHIIKAVEGLREEYPDKGLLLVVDELLDYLRARDERSLILDLGFLRELGEVTALTPFRFVAGLQETLFDNPRFSFVSEQLRRVRDRFEQIRIAREDIAYVVAERLLKKDDGQKARVRAHLTKFASLYPNLAEKMDDFVALFPIHPAYLEIFEELQVVEKREALKTFSHAMHERMDEAVPTDEPGLISFDHYWGVLCANPSMRSVPEIAEVMDKSRVLEERVKAALSSQREHLQPIALRIIHALSVHRLTTQDIYTPIGMTPEELRDRLFLYLKNLPERDAAFLLDQVRAALREIVRAVSGQYISENPANGQYYLDVKKDIDFDAKIRERGEFLGDAGLNPYFFDALRQILGLSESTYVSMARIWFYELPWAEHNVTRLGYIFFGAPDERSTAQPPRDFYIYILPPFAGRDWKDEKREDEVIFRLRGEDAEFKVHVQQYAGARALAEETPSYQKIYLDKAETELTEHIIPWLREHALDRFRVIYQGVEKPLREILAGASSTESENLRGLIDIAASTLLKTCFEERYPDYPRFTMAKEPISEQARPTAAQEALRAIAGRPSKLGQAVLQGLGLMDAEEKIRPHLSPYAPYFLDVLKQKGSEKVVPRSDVLEKVAEETKGSIFKDKRFKLEREWVAVILAALAYHGDIEINLDGRRMLDADAMAGEGLVTTPLQDILDFRHYQAPKELPLEAWKKIFEGLGLSPALIQREDTREQALKELQKKVQDELARVVCLENTLQNGLTLWGEQLFTDNYTIVAQNGIVVGANLSPVSFSKLTFMPDIREYKGFLENLSTINTVGKMRHLKGSVRDVEGALRARENLGRAERLVALVKELDLLAGYLSTAQAALPSSDAWREQAERVRGELVDRVRRIGNGEEAFDQQGLKAKLEDLKKAYIETYAQLHRWNVLDSTLDAQRKGLYQDRRFLALAELEKVELLHSNRGQFSTWKEAITTLRSCPDFHEEMLQDRPLCPSCGFKPVEHAEPVTARARLKGLDEELSHLLEGWRRALRAALNSEQAKASLEALTPSERDIIERFLSAEDDDPDIPAGFAQVANQALRGIRIVPLSQAELEKALKAGGLPCTPDELKSRFYHFVDEALRDFDPKDTRVNLVP